MTYRLNLRITGLAGIVKHPDYFEAWMVDARDPNALRIPSVLVSDERISPHYPDLFFRNASIQNLDGLPIDTPSYVCGEAGSWSRIDLTSYDIMITTEMRVDKAMSLAPLKLLSINELAQNEGQGANVKYTSASVRLRLGDADIYIEPWLGGAPVRFKYRSGGYQMAKAVGIGIPQLDEELIVAFSHRDNGQQAVVRLEGDQEGVLDLILANERRVTDEMEPCAGEGDRDFAAHYHVLTSPAQLHPFYPYPVDFVGGLGPGTDPQCSPVQYKP